MKSIPIDIQEKELEIEKLKKEIEEINARVAVAKALTEFITQEYRRSRRTLWIEVLTENMRRWAKLSEEQVNRFILFYDEKKASFSKTANWIAENF